MDALVWSNGQEDDILANKISDKTTTVSDTSARLKELANKTNGLRDARLIAFDKDGTLGDDQATIGKWARHMTDRMKAAVSPDTVEDCTTEFHSLLGWDAANNHVLPSAPLAAGTWQEQVDSTKKVLSKHGVDPDLANVWHKEMSALHSGDDPVIPNLREMLLECRDGFGLMVTVCTSDVRVSTDGALSRWQVRDVLEDVICGDEVDTPKPSAVPLQTLLTNIRTRRTTKDTPDDDAVTELTPSNCIVVGDTISDTGMARNAGALLCIGVLTGSGSAQQLYDTGADIVLPSVGHVPALLRELQRLGEEIEAE